MILERKEKKMNYKLLPPLVKIQRTCNWREAETDLLVDFWCQKHIQAELRSCPRNQPVFDRIADHLQRNGYNRTPNQCREKVKTLKKEFIHAQHAVKAGAKKKSDFRYWNQIENGMKNRYYNPRPRPRPNNLVATSLSSTRSSRRRRSNAIKKEVVEVVSDVDIVGDYDNSTSYDSADLASFNGEAFTSVDLGYGPTIQETYQIPPDYIDNNHQSSMPFDQTRLEKTIEEAADKMAAVLSETQTRLLEFEEQRMKFVAEQEEKRRKETRDHEIKLLNSVGQMFLQAVQMLQPNRNVGSEDVDGFSVSTFFETTSSLQ